MRKRSDLEREDLIQCSKAEDLHPNLVRFHDRQFDLPVYSALGEGKKVL